MADHELQAQIDSALAYEDLFVVSLFQEWPPRVLDAARAAQGHRVLDVACGTGVLAREAARRVAPSGKVTGLDINPGMLAVAERLAPAIEWRQGAAESLPFADATYDVVVSQFGLMFFTDRHKAVEEMLRVLRPEGQLAVAVWDSLENTPAYAAEARAVQKVAGEQAVEPLRAPFALGDRDELVELFAGAGVESVEIRTHRGTGRFPSVQAMVEADLRGWLPLWGIHLGEDQIRQIIHEAERELHPYVVAQGRVEFDSPAHIVAGRKP